MLTSAHDELNSCIYQVTVKHQRLLPKRHAFEYGLFMFMLDLDESERINERLKLAKINRRALYQFYDEDHFDVTPVATREKLADFLTSKGIQEDFGRVLLITNFRFLGYVFNPISIYFVYDKSGEALVAVAEVGNTFLERKPFLLPRIHDESTGKTSFKLFAQKHFYVSPFSQVDDYFEFLCDSPGENIEIHINTKAGSAQGDESGPTTLISSLRGRREELSDANLIFCTLKYPFVTLGVIGLIHLHALLLWLKKVPFFMKEEKVLAQTDLLNPHRSLNDKTGETNGLSKNLNIHAYKGASQ